jgi:hypothetical protein
MSSKEQLSGIEQIKKKRENAAAREIINLINKKG